MLLHFSKYQGAGNDFIAFDNRDQQLTLTDEQRSRLCHRRFGIGADGVLEIQRSSCADFKLLYYNSDGRPGSLCGNGCRCALAYARYLKVNFSRQNNILFQSFDGVHAGAFLRGEAGVGSRGIYSVSFSDVAPGAVRRYDNGDYFVNTGSPHHVIFLEGNLEACDVVSRGRDLRYNMYGKDGGSNINFAVAGDDTPAKKSSPPSDSNSLSSESGSEGQEKSNDKINHLNGHSGEGLSVTTREAAVDWCARLVSARTYERGVEGETLACGTGAVAIAIVDYVRRSELLLQPAAQARTLKEDEARLEEVKTVVRMPGGDLEVKFVVKSEKDQSTGSDSSVRFSDVTLSGPAQHVFDGVYKL